MKLTALAVVILALGVVLGLALAGGVSERPVSADPKCPGPSSNCTPTPTATATSTPTPTATPTPPQQREDQVTIFADPTAEQPNFIGSSDPNWSFLQRPSFVALDPADYASDSVFRFEAVFNDASPGACMRLFAMSDPLTYSGTAVPGSEICSQEGGCCVERVRSGPLEIPSGELEYIAQFDSNFIINTGRSPAARIIVEWTE